MERKQVVVAFRGTEMVKWKDFVTDVNLVPSDLNPERVQTSANVLSRLLQRSDELQVHGGFLEAYDSVRGKVLDLVEAVVEGEPEEWLVLCTGHSLGGALATLCAYELAKYR